MKEFTALLAVLALILGFGCSGNRHFLLKDPSRLPYELSPGSGINSQYDFTMEGTIVRIYNSMARTMGKQWKHPIVFRVADIYCHDTDPDCVLLKDLQSGLCAYMRKKGARIVTGHVMQYRLEKPDAGLNIQMELKLKKFDDREYGRTASYYIIENVDFFGPDTGLMSSRMVRIQPPAVTLDFP